MTPSPIATPTASLPWAGKVAPGQPVPEQAIQSITASWQELYTALYDYSSVKTNGKPDDKTWWTDQVKRFFTSPALAERLQNIEGWFKSSAMGGPGFIENGVYTLNVKSCSSDTECLLEIHVQSGRWWAYDVAKKQFSKANAVKPFQWNAVMQYDAPNARWQFKALQ